MIDKTWSFGFLKRNLLSWNSFVFNLFWLHICFWFIWPTCNLILHIFLTSNPNVKRIKFVKKMAWYLENIVIHICNMICIYLFIPWKILNQLFIGFKSFSIPMFQYDNYEIFFIKWKLPWTLLSCIWYDYFLYATH